jgi:uncharacterized membrane protein YjfL (UPF0719 family)
MNILSGKNRAAGPPQASEAEQLSGIIFTLVYFLSTYLLHKISGLSLSVAGILVASFFILIAHQIDQKFPLPNKHFWKTVAFALMFPVFLMMAV